MWHIVPRLHRSWQYDKISLNTHMVMSYLGIKILFLMADGLAACIHGAHVDAQAPSTNGLTQNNLLVVCRLPLAVIC